MKLDQTDKKIIQLLGADARMSNNQMAKVIGVTEGTVRNRIQKLIKNRVIKISVINNINRMENPSLAFVGLDVETRAKDSVAKALSKMKEVRFVSSLIGRHDLMAFVLARTNAIRSCRPISDDTNLTSFIFERALATESFARVSTSNPTKAREGFSMRLILLITEILITLFLINF